MFYYAILNEDQIATAVAATTELAAPQGSMALEDYDPSLVGMRWTGTGWEPASNSPAPLTQLAFLRRFTAEERIACRASSDPVVQDFLHLLGLAQEIRLDDADTIAGVGYLESLGLLAEGRAAVVLA